MNESPECSTEQQSPINSDTVDQNMWDSGPALKIEEGFSYDFLDVDFSPVSIGGFANVPFIGQTGIRGPFGGGLELGVSRDFHMNGGSIDVDYQTDVTVSALTTSGAALTEGTDGALGNLEAGDHFILRAFESPDDSDIAMETEFANIGAGLYLDYGVDVNASLLGRIPGRTVVNTGIDKSFSDSIELVGADSDLGDGVGEVRLLADIPLIMDNTGNLTLTGSYIDPGVNDAHDLWVTWGDETSDGHNINSRFEVPAIGSLSVGQTIRAEFAGEVPQSPDSTLTITSVDTSTGRVGFQMTGKSYAGSPGTMGEGSVFMRDQSDYYQKDWCFFEIPWRPDPVVSHVTSTVNESGPVELQVSFDMPDNGGAVQILVDWDDPNDSQPSTFDFNLDFGVTAIGDRFFARELKHVGHSIFPNANLIFTGVENTEDPDVVRVTMTLERGERPVFVPYVDDGSVNGNHTTSDVSSVKVQLCTEGLEGSKTVPITVNDLAPTLTFDGPTEIAGPSGLAPLSGTIGDLGLYDGHEMHIDWGDGTAEVITFDALPLGWPTGATQTARTIDTTPVVDPQDGTLTINAGELATYRIRETQPVGVDDGAAVLGDAGGDVLSANEMQLTLTGTDALDYVFTELSQAVQAGDTASIGFWQNKHGQALIEQGGQRLLDWLLPLRKLMARRLAVAGTATWAFHQADVRSAARRHVASSF